ncbi:MAG: CofH family radical SAM protein [Rikenellaceae bacterium]
MIHIPQHIEIIAQKCRMSERISPAEALALWHDAPLWLLAKLAVERKREVSGDAVFYNRNFHLEPTNICRFRCKFCSFRRGEGSEDSWNYSMEEMEQIAQSYTSRGVTEVHIVGGVHPSHSLGFFEELIARVKSILPQATIKAFTAIELSYMIREAGITIDEGLRRLKAAGMESIPGGGAEIFDDEIRSEICGDKGSTSEWFAIHDAAHRMGISTNCTILYGHVESIEHRIDHLLRLREQQDKTGGFNAFIPLKYRSVNNDMSHLGEVSIMEDLRMLSISRLFLDNIPHIKAYWVMYGKQTAELALSFGADDIDGTIDDSTKIYSMAGAEDQRPRMTIEEIEEMARRAGLRAVERDTHYNIIS